MRKLLKNFIDTLLSQTEATLIDSIEENFTSDMNLQDITNKCYLPIKKIILSADENNDLKFEGGVIVITLVTSKKFTLKFNLIFSKDDGQLKKWEQTSYPFDAQKYLSSEAQEELKNAESCQVSFDVDILENS